jgi:methionyl-tRNA synthetase
LVPDAGEYNEYDLQVIESFRETKEKVEIALDNFRFREALKEAMNLARIGNKYLADTEPWKVYKTDETRVGTILNISLQICANLSIILYPFLPGSTETLKTFLALDEFTWDRAGSNDLLKPGHQINQAGLLFEKIEDEVIEAQLNRLIENRKNNDLANAEVSPTKNLVNFDEFTKMDIRVAKIIDAEKVAKTKKLLKLTVDTGLDKRTIVSGIAEYFEPETLKGKRVCILLNLEPRSIKGIESRGMILLSENKDGSLYFVEPSEKAAIGSEVR